MIRIVLVISIIILVIVLAVFAFMQLPSFGSKPDGDRLERIKKSPNYRDGAFQNESYTPTFTGKEESRLSIIKKFLSKGERARPKGAIPSTKTDLLHLDPHADVLVWFGHSSYFIQIDGKRILVDPIFSGEAGPLPLPSLHAFKGTDRYTTDDLPAIDYLFITHDHWDHLDYDTVNRLKKKVKRVICGLGVGAHLERWGYQKRQIIEEDWNKEMTFENGFTVYVLPSRHFSGRSFTRNQTLWAAYVLETPTMRFFFGGDGGYDKHFAKIGKKFGHIDLAILENGQYNVNWKYIHMSPEETLQAAIDLKAKRLFPVHSSKFSLANHDWDEPLIRISKLCKDAKFPLITPIIGEQVNLKDSTQHFREWWKGVK